jgi:hypothetical protein
LGTVGVNSYPSCIEKRNNRSLWADHWRGSLHAHVFFRIRLISWLKGASARNSTMCNYCGMYGYGYGYGYGSPSYGLPLGYGYSGATYPATYPALAAPAIAPAPAPPIAAAGAPFLATVVPLAPAPVAPMPAPIAPAPVVAPIALAPPRGEYRVGNCLCICQ